MYGPVFGISKTSAAGGITLNGYYIPGGTQLSVCICALPLKHCTCVYMYAATHLSDVSYA